MFASVFSHEPIGFEGKIVSVEVDIRRGIPGIDLVGLPDSAVREARERVRVAIRNSGFKFPADRILVNLAPADLRKEGSSYDLPIALGILMASGQIKGNIGKPVMIVGELNLTGMVKGVNGAISAVISGAKHGIRRFLVPKINLFEAVSVGSGRVFGINSLKEAVSRLSNINNGCQPERAVDYEPEADFYSFDSIGDFADVKGHNILKRALEVAAAGGHNVLLFGPPGVGKSMSIYRFPTILPPLERDESLEVTRIHSIAGVLPPNSGLIRYRPFRAPHHTSSIEGVIGGGNLPKPGEVSLAHRGVLFLDETPEFKTSLLQSLREPIENGSVTVSRVGRTVTYPAKFQLIMAANACPCGNLGKKEGNCVCTSTEIRRYWKKIGGALLDRIDIRVPVSPVSTGEMLKEGEERSSAVAARVREAVKIQKSRFAQLGLKRNSEIPPGEIDNFCKIGDNLRRFVVRVAEKLTLSSRAIHSILKIARTIADLEGRERICEEHILEAVQHRRFGDSDLPWI